MSWNVIKGLNYEWAVKHKHCSRAQVMGDVWQFWHRYSIYILFTFSSPVESTNLDERIKQNKTGTKYCKSDACISMSKLWSTSNVGLWRNFLSDYSIYLLWTVLLAATMSSLVFHLSSKSKCYRETLKRTKIKRSEFFSCEGKLGYDLDKTGGRPEPTSGGIWLVNCHVKYFCNLVVIFMLWTI